MSGTPRKPIAQVGRVHEMSLILIKLDSQMYDGNILFIIYKSEFEALYMDWLPLLS